MKKILFLLCLVLCATLFADFHLVRDGKAAAQFKLPAKENLTVESRVKLFNKYVKKITGAELPLKNAALPNTIELDIIENPPMGKHYEYEITFPSDKVMKITATPKSIFDALNMILENGNDARFLGVENSMFQYNPSKNLAMPQKNLKSPDGYTIYRGVYRLPNNSIELGIINDGSFAYNHGLPVYAFPESKYKNGWPAAVMPVLHGKKLMKPPAKIYHNWQPCYSNMECAEIAAGNILEYLAKNPRQSISLGVNDNGGYCQCTECKKLDDGKRPAIFANNRSNKSESYYTWLNRVLNIVCKKYPDLRVGILAYTGTIMPPTFKVHDNVVPMLTLDSVCEAFAPNTKKLHRQVIEEWGKNVKEIGVWDYGWGGRFFLPRVNFKNQIEFMKFHYANNGRAYFSERSMVDALDGPKTYLTARLLKDPNADAEALLEDWYIRYAGKNGAKYVKQIYNMCEKYWTEGDIVKTPIYKARTYIYMFPTPTYLFALKEGFTQELVELAKKAHAAAETDGEKMRTLILQRMMERLDVIASFTGAPFRNPADGEMKTKEDVAAYLKFIKNNLKRLNKEQKNCHDYFLNPDLPASRKDVYISGSKKLFEVDSSVHLSEGLLKTFSFAEDKDIIALFNDLLKEPDLPAGAKETIKIILDGRNAKNYFEFAGFKKDIKDMKVRSTVPYEVSSDVLCNGEKTLKILPANFKGAANPNDVMLSGVVAFTINQKVSPGIYAVSLKVFTPNPRAIMDLSLWRSKNGGNRDWEDLRQIKVRPNEWQTFSQVRTVTPGCDSVNIIIRPSRFKKNEPLYIGDIRLIKISNPSRQSKVLPAPKTVSVRSIQPRSGSVRTKLFDRPVILNNKPSAYPIGAYFFNWGNKSPDDVLELTFDAAQLPQAKTGKIGLIIYGYNGKDFVAKRTLLWDVKLPKDKFKTLKAKVNGSVLGKHSRYMLLFFKMKKTEGIAFSEVKMEFKSAPEKKAVL
ncbi:MAG: DUF4838 domain-containing protein [Lentisphaeria bacterium]|nr:DUF4838 domain-containing protein [Lentisphaeria bacterium]